MESSISVCARPFLRKWVELHFVRNRYTVLRESNVIYRLALGDSILEIYYGPGTVELGQTLFLVCLVELGRTSESHENMVLGVIRGAR